VSEPFEDPRKTELRERCKIAIDAAGHGLVAQPLTFRAGEGLQGGIKGDVQSLDGDEERYSYYLRLDPGRAVPQWLVNLARVARAGQDVTLFLVTGARHAVLERSCRSGQVGLLLLTEENTFEMLVDPTEADADVVAAEIATKARDARRRMETKLRLNTGSIEDNYARVNDLTVGMTSTVRDRYIEGVEASASAWDEWGQRVSAMLDEAAANGDEALLGSAEQLIEEGAGA